MHCDLIYWTIEVVQRGKVWTINYEVNSLLLFSKYHLQIGSLYPWVNFSRQIELLTNIEPNNTEKYTLLAGGEEKLFSRPFLQETNQDFYATWVYHFFWKN
jgi:hypothetical protein